MSTDSTRHKSRNGETHIITNIDYDSLLQYRKFFQNSTFDWLRIPDSKVEDNKEENEDQVSQSSEQKPVISHFYNRDLTEFKSATFDSLLQAKKFFQNSTFEVAFYYDFKTEEKLLVEYKKPNSEVEGIKETNGKLDYSEINFKLLDLMAKRFMDNKVKYPKGNTKKSLDKNEILWAAFRHIRKMIQPIENDPETFEDHLAAVATNMSIILDQLEKQ